MEIKETKDAGSLTLQLSGRLDTVTAPQLEDTLRSNLAGVERLTIDFKELAYISSAGLRVLLFAQKAMNKQGSMVITNVNETVMEVFEITGFVDILTIE